MMKKARTEAEAARTPAMLEQRASRPGVLPCVMRWATVPLLALGLAVAGCSNGSSAADAGAKDAGARDAGGPDVGKGDRAQSDARSRTPAYQAKTWTHLGGPIGGLGYDVRYKFSDHKTWFVTDAWAGLHMSTDQGESWLVSNQGITSRAGAGAGDAIPVFSATVDPHRPDTVWIGCQNTGKIYKSTDGGKTWVDKTNGITAKNPLSFRGFTVDPEKSDLVYAMGEIGSPGWTPDGSSRQGLELDLTMGVVYKTVDGGEHWTEIWRGDNLARYLWVDPRDTRVLFVSTGIFDRESANTDVAKGFAGGVGILKSTDGGKTWRVLNQANGLLDLYVGSLFMKPGSPDVLLAAAAQNNWSAYGGKPSTAGVYRTENGGETWTRVLADGETYASVEYCPSDSSIAYAGSNKAVYRSSDGGKTWQRFARADGRWGPDGIVAGWPIDMQCDPDDPMKVFVNNYLGGVFVSTDGGRTWKTASRGYSGAQTRHVAVSVADARIVYAGGRTGPFRSDNGGTDWAGLAYPPSGVESPLNEIQALALDPTSADHLLIVPADVGLPLYSRDGGKTWSVSSVSPIAEGASANLLAFAPSDPQLAYGAATPACARSEEAVQCDTSKAALYRSEDGGDSFTLASRGVAVLALAVHPQYPRVIVAGTSDAGVQWSADGGDTWTAASTGLPKQALRAVALDPARPEVAFAGTFPGGIYRTADRGTSWSQTSAGLPAEAFIDGIVVDPGDSQIVYASDYRSGVYVSTDGGSSWRALVDGLLHRTVMALSLSSDGSVLYAAIEGAGIFRLGAP